jgi:hypothetical protein
MSFGKEHVSHAGKEQEIAKAWLHGSTRHAYIYAWPIERARELANSRVAFICSGFGGC